MEYKSGLRIGRYVLESRIDSGGEAQVWKAYNDKIPVAMKLRPPAQLDKRQDVSELSSAFAHEQAHWIEFTRSSLYIVHILDVISEVLSDDGGVEWVIHAIVSEYSEIGDLQKAIENGVLRENVSTEVQFIQFLQCLISGVKAGHDSQIFHCDIKPKNVLVFRDSGNIVPKLTDFGIAVSALQPIKGLTPGYSAPELTTGVAPTAKSDVYSLGITFYDILYATLLKSTTRAGNTGRSYKTGKEYKDYLRRISDDATQSAFAVPYISLIDSMAEEEAESRPDLGQVAAILASGLARVLSNVRPYRVKTKPDTYLWNPAVHELLGEKLYFILVKGNNPAIDLKEVIDDLENAGFPAFTIRSVFGEWDFVIRIWIPNSSTIAAATSAAARGARTAHALDVVRAHLNIQQKRRADTQAKIRSAQSEVQLLKEIEGCSGDKEFERLQDGGYVLARVNNEGRNFHVTFLVSIRGFSQFANMIGVSISGIIKEDKKAKVISFYEVTPLSEVSSVRLIVTFAHTDFIACRATLLSVYAKLVPEGNHFNFSTLWDMDAKSDRHSDDGTIMGRIRAALTTSL